MSQRGRNLEAATRDNILIESFGGLIHPGGDS